jgi:hypothetical protein
MKRLMLFLFGLILFNIPSFADETSPLDYDLETHNHLDYYMSLNGNNGYIDMRTLYIDDDVIDSENVHILRNTPWDDEYMIYYTGTTESYHITILDLDTSDYNEIVSFTYKNHVYTNTREACYKLFGDTRLLTSKLEVNDPGAFSIQWYTEIFGTTYTDWYEEQLIRADLSSLLQRYIDRYISKSDEKMTDRYAIKNGFTYLSDWYGEEEFSQLNMNLDYSDFYSTLNYDTMLLSTTGKIYLNDDLGNTLLTLYADSENMNETDFYYYFEDNGIHMRLHLVGGLTSSSYKIEIKGDDLINFLGESSLLLTL